MSLASNFGKLKSQAGMEEWEGAVGAGWEATGRAMWREDVFVFEVHCVPSLGPISHRISAPAMAHAGKGSKSVLGVCLRGLSLPRGVVRS